MPVEAFVEDLVRDEMVEFSTGSCGLLMCYEPLHQGSCLTGSAPFSGTIETSFGTPPRAHDTQRRLTSISRAHTTCSHLQLPTLFLSRDCPATAPLPEDKPRNKQAAGAPQAPAAMAPDDCFRRGQQESLVPKTFFFPPCTSSSHFGIPVRYLIPSHVSDFYCSFPSAASHS